MNSLGDTANSQNSRIENLTNLPKIALIADVENWAFHNYARQIKKNLSGSYDFKIFFHSNYEQIEDLLLEVKDFDLIHFFWRDALLNLLSSGVQYSFAQKGWNYFDFITDVVANANLTTSIYDHLRLSEQEIQEREILFNALSVGYTTVSQRLYELYSSIDNYPKPFSAVEDGVDLEFFTPCNLERLSDEKKEIVVGWVGYSKWGGDGIDHKGLETIIKPAIESLRAEGYKLRGFYADRHERWIPHSEMNDYYNSIDVYVCASDIEGTPNPALESMACGLPVISTDVGIIPHLFGKLQQDYILPDRSVESLKKKLKELIESPWKREALSKENLEEIKKWTWRKQCEKWDEFFQAMLAGSQGYVKERRDFLRKRLLSDYLLPSAAESLETVREVTVEDSVMKAQYAELSERSGQLERQIDLMEQSSFWKARKNWIKFKQSLGFAKHQH